jgi:excisionase family DNA binding protein
LQALAGPVVILDGRDCAVLARQLVEAIRLGYTVRDRPPPRALLDLAGRLNVIARGSGEDRDDCQDTGHDGPGRFRVSLPLPSSGQPATGLTVAEAARLGAVSEGYLRKLIRRGDIEASRDGRSAGYLVRADSVAAWASQRREERDRKAA